MMNNGDTSLSRITKMAGEISASQLTKQATAVTDCLKMAASEGPSSYHQDSGQNNPAFPDDNQDFHTDTKVFANVFSFSFGSDFWPMYRFKE